MKRSIGVALLLSLLVGLAWVAYCRLRMWRVSLRSGSPTRQRRSDCRSGCHAGGHDKTNSTYHADDRTRWAPTRLSSVPPGPGYKVTILKAAVSQPIEETAKIALTVANTRIPERQASCRGSSVADGRGVSAANDEVTINTTDATIGNNFDVKLLNDLPVQVRDSPSALFSLQPGVAASSVTGARTDQSYITVDGMDVNDITTGQTFLVVANAPVDSLEEFRGTVAEYSLTAVRDLASGGQFQAGDQERDQHFPWRSERVPSRHVDRSEPRGSATMSGLFAAPL